MQTLNPSLEVLCFPAWDTVPYDRSSPQAHLMAERAQTLGRLKNLQGKAPLLVLTTLKSIVQRVLPIGFQGEEITLKPQETLDRDDLIKSLTNQGYHRVMTVREPGEFAVRGSLIDLFPLLEEQGYRLDFFGDEIEEIKVFDPLTQVSKEAVSSLILSPFQEFPIQESQISLFRSQYRELFGAQSANDPLYQEVSLGHRPKGVEQWAPLFFEKPLPSLFDTNQNITVVLPSGWEEALAKSWELIEEYYQGRLALLKSKTESLPYYPLPPEKLYVSLAELQDAAKNRTLLLSPFAPASEKAGAHLSFKPISPFGPHRGQRLEELKGRISDAAYPLILTVSSEGQKAQIARLFEDVQIPVQGEAVLSQNIAELEPGLWIGQGDFLEGFQTPEFELIPASLILGKETTRSAKQQKDAANFIAEASALSPGDLIVHEDHGIGRFIALTPLDIDGAVRDFIELEYADQDKLYLPAENLDLLTRYGSGEMLVPLDRLGAKGWQLRKAKAKGRIKVAAEKVIELAAQRALKKAPLFPLPGESYGQFERRFPFQETDDQLAAISDVIQDLERGQPMDRLICGDVGFGKTEVALRAAFIVAGQGAQVAVIVPTTLLCRQHSANFQRRFQDTGLKVASLSRLTTPNQAKGIRRELKEGKVDIVIGTHALLSKHVSFKNLGLVIVDEEQHFGVQQKEKIRSLAAQIHVLTLTATPIPRTLQMSMSGVRDMSLISTPPVDRLAVRTFISPLDPLIVKEALLREKHRGGQSFVVCPYIKNLTTAHELLQELVPDMTVGVAHGGLTGPALDQVMTQFDAGEIDILLATNIIESGIDIARANTLVVMNAHLFGLAQLYQIRGRIGRSKERGYAYLTWPEATTLTPQAEKRLSVLQTLDTLGAGFQLASHDMDIRGPGNLLGEEQSGHIKEVGVELYQHMLQEAIAEIQAQDQGAPSREIEEHWSPQLQLGISFILPQSYIADDAVRIDFYKRLSCVTDKGELGPLIGEMVDRFGALPGEAENLIQVIELKLLCRETQVEKIEAGNKGFLITFHKNTFPGVAGLMIYLRQHPNWAKIRPDQRLFISQGLAQKSKRLGEAKSLLTQLRSFVSED